MGFFMEVLSASPPAPFWGSEGVTFKYNNYKGPISVVTGVLALATGAGAQSTLLESKPVVSNSTIDVNKFDNKYSPLPKPMLFGPADYPAEALTHHWQGDVMVDLIVGSDGTVRACTIAQSSGYSILDKATCDVFHQRAKFKPARDNKGKPIEGQYCPSIIRWSL